MNRAVRATAITLVLLTATVACAQPGGPSAPTRPTLRGDSTQTRKRLAEAEQKLIAGKAADAADDTPAADRRMPATTSSRSTGRQYRPPGGSRTRCSRSSPPDVLKAYQDRIDQPAKKLLAQAKQYPRPAAALATPRPLFRVAAHRRGATTARRTAVRARRVPRRRSAWRRLLPDAGADIFYRDSKADPALVRARIALAVIFQGDAGRPKQKSKRSRLGTRTQMGRSRGRPARWRTC